MAFKGTIKPKKKKLCSSAKRFANTHLMVSIFYAKRNLIICFQSNAETQDLQKNVSINPLGDWTGGLNVDTGATNRKLGSDMAQSVQGPGGLHGKDLSKADVSVNISMR